MRIRLGIYKILATIIPSVLFIGCLYKQAPDLQESRWISITVEYMVEGNGSKIERKSWTTDDQKILDHLQKSLTVTHSGDLWGAGIMLSNKIELRLANGKSWTIYIVEPTKLTINDSLTPERGFGLDVTPDFVEVVKTTIESINNETVRFF